MERVVVTAEEAARAEAETEGSRGPEAKLPPAIALWARICLAPLVLVLPVLCVVSVILRVATRGLPPRNRFAWASYFSTLLAISGVLTTGAAVVALYTGATPTVVSEGLSELDRRTSFAVLPSAEAMSSEAASDKLMPLVTVMAPAAKKNWWHNEGPANALGAGVILSAGKDGYLIATARHVIDGEGLKGDASRALVAAATGTWSGAEVVGRHKTLDLLLVWLPRAEGEAKFLLPVALTADLKVGEPITVIGHPQGLRYTMSTGIVSRQDAETIQISAPVSPGNSGGPVFDSRGRLVGIVVAMVDRARSPNAENLNFALRADQLLNNSSWDFTGDGKKRLESFAKAQPAGNNN